MLAKIAIFQTDKINWKHVKRGRRNLVSLSCYIELETDIYILSTSSNNTLWYHVAFHFFLNSENKLQCVNDDGLNVLITGCNMHCCPNPLSTLW